MLHYDGERCTLGRWIECISRKFHVADLAVKVDDDRVLRWASSENARNNFGNTLLAELGLPMRNCESQERDERYINEYSHDAWGVPSSAKSCSRS
jgi:hypothetical protein